MCQGNNYKWPENTWMLTAPGKAWTHWKRLCESVCGCDRKRPTGDCGACVAVNAVSMEAAGEAEKSSTSSANGGVQSH